MTDYLPKIYKDNKRTFWIVALIIVPISLFLGCLLWREIFWDNFIWRYIWGPVVADARDETVNGISAGYNIVNTLVYGISLIIAILGILEIFHRYKIKVDRLFIFSLLPWVILGGTLRSLEDAGFFSRSMAPFFISPVIYLVLGISAIITMVFGAKLSLYEGDTRAVRALSLTPPLLFLLLLDPPHMAYVLPFTVILLIIFYIIGHRKKILDERYLFGAYGMTLLSLTLIYISNNLRILEGTRPLEIPIILFLTVISSAVFLVIPWTFSKKVASLKVFVLSLNPLIVFAHMMDASATYRGISAYGYVEKHVLPALAIDVTGTSLVMYPLKLFLVVFVIYSLDIWFREELKDLPELKFLLQFAIITLGLAPGVRNMLRLAMGV